MKPKIFLLLIIILASILRLYRVPTIPPGLYVDEASIGFNAYSILKTGKDEHNKSYPLMFEAFGEYKLPLYIYLTSAIMSFLGKNEFTVRSVSVFSGILTILVVYQLIKKLGHGNRTALLISFLLSSSSWHIQFSRGGFEATLGLMLYYSGITAVLGYVKKGRTKQLLLSMLFFLLSFFTYNAYRIITPLTVLFTILIIPIKFRKSYINTITAAGIILFIIMFYNQEGIVSRFNQTSFLGEYRNFSQIQKILFAPFGLIRNYVSYLSPVFIFGAGDGIGRHQMPGFGLIPYLYIPFLIYGLFYAFIKKNKFKIILFLLLISFLPGAVSLPSPHTLRSLSASVPLLFLTGLGILAFLKKNRFMSSTVFTVFFIYTFGYYLHFYFIHYPSTNPTDWGGKYKETVTTAMKYKDMGRQIVLDPNFGEKTYIYFLFYNNEVPELFGNIPLISGNTIFITGDPEKGVSRPAGRIIETIMLDNPNRDTFSTFWEQ